jgi:hypothetical protein
MWTNCKEIEVKKCVQTVKKLKLSPTFVGLVNRIYIFKGKFNCLRP